MIGNRIEIEDPFVLAVAKPVLQTVQLAFHKAIAHTADPRAFPIPGAPDSLERIILGYVKKRSPEKRRIAVDKTLRVISASPSEREEMFGELARVDLHSAKAIEEQIKTLRIPTPLKWPEGHFNSLRLVNNRLLSVSRPRPVLHRLPENYSEHFRTIQKSVTWYGALRLHELTYVPVVIPGNTLPAIRQRWEVGVAAIQHKHSELGAGTLGSPVGQTTQLSGGGIKQDYEHGSIYWHSETGAYGMRSPIRDKWLSLGAGASFLGYPITDTKTTGVFPGDMPPDKPGLCNYFQNGAIYWSEQTSAYEIHGAILAKWEEVGGEGSYLGYPLTDETTTPDGKGRYNHFEGGSIYWTPDTGAHAITRVIRDKWAFGLGTEFPWLPYYRLHANRWPVRWLYELRRV
jgi:hypothetical protein